MHPTFAILALLAREWIRRRCEECGMERNRCGATVPSNALDCAALSADSRTTGMSTPRTAKLELRERREHVSECFKLRCLTIRPPIAFRDAHDSGSWGSAVPGAIGEAQSALLSTVYILLGASAPPREIMLTIDTSHASGRRACDDQRSSSFDRLQRQSLAKTQRSQRDPELNSKAIDYAGI